MTSNIAEFTSQIGTLGKAFPAQYVNKRVRTAGLKMFRAFDLAAPVNSGRFRGETQVTIGTPASGLTGKADPGGSDTLTKGVAVIQNAPDFPTIWISNNMPYAEAIDRGGYQPPNPENSPEANARRKAGRDDRTRRRAAAVAGEAGAPLIRGGFLIQRPAGITPLVIQAGLESLRQE